MGDKNRVSLYKDDAQGNDSDEYYDSEEEEEEEEDLEDDFEDI